MGHPLQGFGGGIVRRNRVTALAGRTVQFHVHETPPKFPRRLASLLSYHASAIPERGPLPELPLVFAQRPGQLTLVHELASTQNPVADARGRSGARAILQNG